MDKKNNFFIYVSALLDESLIWYQWWSIIQNTDGEH